MKSIVFKILVLILMTSCNESRMLSSSGSDSILNRIQYAQNYADYVNIGAVKDVLTSYNMNNQNDTLVLYTVVTHFYADDRKPIQYLRLCFLSDPYQFYQTKLEKGNGKYTIGTVDRLAKSIEILRNETPYKTVSEIHYTIVE